MIRDNKGEQMNKTTKNPVGSLAILRQAACSAVALAFALSAYAATPTAEWYGGTYGDSTTQFEDSAWGSSFSGVTQNGLTIKKNNSNNISTPDYMQIADGESQGSGWPMIVSGSFSTTISVVIGYTTYSDRDGTILALTRGSGGSGSPFRYNVVGGELKAGFQANLSWGSLDKTQPTDEAVHFAVMTYSNSGGTSFYFDGQKLKDCPTLKEGQGAAFTEIALGAVRGPADIVNGAKYSYVAVYNGTRLTDAEAFEAYKRAFEALNGSATPVTRTIAADATANWSDAEWTVGDAGAPSVFTPDASGGYDVTVTVGGDCSIAMPASIGSFSSCNIAFALAEGVSSATVNLVYPAVEDLADSATTRKVSPFGAANIIASAGVTLTKSYGGAAAGFKTQFSGYDLYVAKRPSVGVVSVKIGARGQTAETGCIDQSYSGVGAYPLSALFWDQTKAGTSGGYSDIQSLSDAKDEDGSSAVTITYYGQNTWYNTSGGSGSAVPNNPCDTPNNVLTATYLDDSNSGSTNLTATSSADGTTVTLPTPGHERGWQLHFENIPYNAYDVYFITASDVRNGNLKECPIYVSLDGGTSWKSYCGDSANEKTVMGTDSWTGLPYAIGGNLVHGKNYIKMRITKSLYGENIGTIDITHGVRDTSNSTRSGLAAIQIVEVENDGVYTLADSGNWTTDAIWNVGSLTEQLWSDAVDGEASIAKIVTSEQVGSVTVDAPVSAGQVVLTGSDDFTVAGTSTLTVETGFDASAFAGALNLQAPISGTIYIGENTTLEFGDDTNMALPAYSLDGAGAWTKVGTGTLTVGTSLPLAGVVEEGNVEFHASTSGNITLEGGNLVLAGDGTTDLVYSGTASLAENASGKTTITAGTVQSRGSIATDIDVEQGATLKLGAVGGFGSSGTAPSGKTITVYGTVELNGQEGCNEYTLAGGTLQNTGSAINTESQQTMKLTLTDDSTVHAGADFGLLNRGWNETTLNLGGHTLTKTGDAKFWLYNTRSEQTGTINITAGSVDAYSTVSLPNVAFNIAEGASLKIRTASFAAHTLSGKGTVSIGTNRANPMPTLNFAVGNELALEIVLASTTEASLEIPYTGAAPKSVTVYGTDWTTVDAAATATIENGVITVNVEVFDSNRANPVTGATTAFSHAFAGSVDGSWETLGNWHDISGSRWAAYTQTLAPHITGSNYEPVLFDGTLMDGLEAGADGHKEVTANALEGWTTRLGLFNGVRVTVDQVKKQQGGCWYMVDETSQLVMNRNTRAGNNGGDVDLYVAAPDGIVYSSDFDFTGCASVNYHFKGEGSVKYVAGPTKGAHKISRVILPADAPKSSLKKLIKRKLVAFGTGSGFVTFDLSAAEVTSLNSTLTMTKFTPPEEEPEATLTTDAAFGTYQLTQEADGVYITYVGYGVPFTIRLR